MATVPYAQAKITGTVLAATAATAGPDSVAPDERAGVLVHNRSGAGITVDVVIPGNTKYGPANPDVTTVSIPASGLAIIGPLPFDIADPADGMVKIDTSASASVDLYAIRF